MEINLENLLKNIINNKFNEAIKLINLNPDLLSQVLGSKPIENTEELTSTIKSSLIVNNTQMERTLYFFPKEVSSSILTDKRKMGLFFFAILMSKNDDSYIDTLKLLVREFNIVLKDESYIPQAGETLIKYEHLAEPLLRTYSFKTIHKIIEILNLSLEEIVIKMLELRNSNIKILFSEPIILAITSKYISSVINKEDIFNKGNSRELLQANFGHIFSETDYHDSKTLKNPINLVLNNQKTLLQMAIERNNAQFATNLISLGAGEEEYDPVSNISIVNELHYFFILIQRYNFIEAFKILKDSANLRKYLSTNQEAKNILDILLGYNFFVKILIDYKISNKPYNNECDAFGNTPVILNSFIQHIATIGPLEFFKYQIQFLLNENIDINQTDEYNITPLDIVINLEKFEIAKYLLSIGVGQNKNSPLQNFLYLLNQKSYDKIVPLLKNQYSTQIIIASLQKNLNQAKMLRFLLDDDNMRDFIKHDDDDKVIMSFFKRLGNSEDFLIKLAANNLSFMRFIIEKYMDSINIYDMQAMLLNGVEGKFYQLRNNIDSSFFIEEISDVQVHNFLYYLNMNNNLEAHKLLSSVEVRSFLQSNIIAKSLSSKIEQLIIYCAQNKFNIDIEYLNLLEPMKADFSSNLFELAINNKIFELVDFLISKYGLYIKNINSPESLNFISLCMENSKIEMINKGYKFASTEDHIDLIKLLINSDKLDELRFFIKSYEEQSLDISPLKEQSFELLKLTIGKNFKKASSLLVELGLVNINRLNSEGIGLIHHIATDPYIVSDLSSRIMRTFLTLPGVNIDLKNIHGETALHEAASRLDRTLSELLIEEGADINALDNKMNTPLMLAMKELVGNRYIKLIPTFLKHKPKLNIVNNKNKTTLDIAKELNIKLKHCNENRDKMVISLRKSGALHAHELMQISEDSIATTETIDSSLIPIPSDSEKPSKPESLKKRNYSTEEEPTKFTKPNHDDDNPDGSNPDNQYSSNNYLPYNIGSSSATSSSSSNNDQSSSSSTNSHGTKRASGNIIVYQHSEGWWTSRLLLEDEAYFTPVSLSHRQWNYMQSREDIRFDSTGDILYTGPQEYVGQEYSRSWLQHVSQPEARETISEDNSNNIEELHSYINILHSLLAGVVSVIATSYITSVISQQTASTNYAETMPSIAVNEVCQMVGICEL